MLRICLIVLLLAGCASPPDMSDIEQSSFAEAKAYSALLTQKLDRGEISQAEAEHLYQQKVNELSARYEATLRVRTQPAPRREVTTCQPDGYGGVRCTTR